VRHIILTLTLFSCLGIFSGCVVPGLVPPETVPTDVTVVNTSYQVELNPARPATQGLIFYPGGLVAPEAYIPLLAPLADAGVRVIITRPWLGLAVFNPQAAWYVVDREPPLQWYVAGHSLGGAMAVKAVKGKPQLFAGLALLGAYADTADDYSQGTLPVVSISATQDGLSTPAEIEAGKSRLPADTRYVVLEGGNHAQFGSYGPQRGDGNATMSEEKQQQLTRQALWELLAISR
jgi:hypothetical protein